MRGNKEGEREIRREGRKSKQGRGEKEEVEEEKENK